MIQRTVVSLYGITGRLFSKAAFVQPNTNGRGVSRYDRSTMQQPPDIPNPEEPTGPTVPEPTPQPPDVPNPYPVTDPMPDLPTPQPVEGPPNPEELPPRIY